MYYVTLIYYIWVHSKYFQIWSCFPLPLPTTELQQVFFFFMKLKALMPTSPQTFVILIICLKDFFFHLKYVMIIFLNP